MPSTYEPIATQTLGSAASSITFSSIPATYTDLRLVLTCFKDGADEAYPAFQLNTDTATNYSTTRITGNGSTATSSRQTNQTSIMIDGEFGGTSTIPTFGTVDLLNYAGSTNKTCLVTNNCDKNGTGGVGRLVGLWRNTAAITSIKIIGVGLVYNLGVGTTATLYGIKNA